MNRVALGLAILLIGLLILAAYYFLFARINPYYAGKSTPAPTNERELIVDSVSDLPRLSLLNLALTARLIDRQERLLEITARINSEPSEPYEDVRGEIQLPAGLTLKQGSLHWQGAIQGDEIKQFQAIVQATQDLKGMVKATAYAYVNSDIVAGDEEVFYVHVENGVMRISLNPYLILSNPLTPGNMVQE
jgi:hypothetical protein